MSDNKKIKALDIADYFIYKSNQENKPLTNKKLQKLLYYSQVWSLVLNDEKLFPERIEAWIHGPAIPSIYRKFKYFGFNPLDVDTSEYTFNFDEKIIKLLDRIWSIYGKYDARYLEALSHSELPWQEARKSLSPSESSKKSISLITAKKFYANKLKSKNS
jgi:uncharacterized phage-associated protein